MRWLELEHLWRPQGWLSPAFVCIDDGGGIAQVRAESAGEASGERVRGYVLPGMPNLHSHAFQRAMAGLAEHASTSDESFWTWRKVMYDIALRLEPEDVEAIAAQLYVEMLKAGYTSVAEFHYLHRAPDGSSYADPAELSLSVVRAAARAGIAITLLGVLYQTGGFGGLAPSVSQRRFVLETDELLSILARVRQLHPAIRVGVAPHSLRAVGPDALSRLLAGLPDDTAPVHIHIAEQQREVDECLAWSGARPIEWLLDNAPVDARWCLVHATHATDAEITAIGRSGAVVGLCPTTEANLGDGVFPFASLLAQHGRFGIGSDSQISVNAVEELRWLEYAQRLVSRRRNVASDAASLWLSAVEGGAQALGRPSGAVEPGRCADLIVLDPEHPSLVGRPLERVLDCLVFAASTSAVRDVMVGGRWVVRDGHHAAEERTLAAYRAAIRRLR